MGRPDAAVVDEHASAGFYVTVRVSDLRGAPLLGPYDTHEEALEHVDRAQGYVEEHTRDGAWWAYGTSRITALPHKTLPVGKLNHLIGLVVNAAEGVR